MGRGGLDEDQAVAPDILPPLFGMQANSSVGRVFVLMNPNPNWRTSGVHGSRIRIIKGVLLLVLVVTGHAYADTAELYAESFDIVWKTIHERFFDPLFHGVDWTESRERYRAQVVEAEDDEQFYVLMNSMLFELGVSHLGVVQTHDPRQLGEAAIFGEGTVGIDVRLVGGRLFITAVEEGSAAAEAGLEIGNEILRLNGRTVEEIASEAVEFPTPPFTERTVIWRYRGRACIDDIYFDPVERPYLGRLVILVDGARASSSEEFSGGLQAMGRATIVGERTPGRVLVMDVTVLPLGAYFIFPIAETMTSTSVVLEHRGVIPDVESLFTMESLKTGRDVQLDAALAVPRGDGIAERK